MLDESLQDNGMGCISRFFPLLFFPSLIHACYCWDESLQCNEIRKTNSNQIVIGKTPTDNDKEEFDNDADDDDADNGEESEGEEFEQETG